eukprot:CAMPEP_0202489372 /NCGR_PEP_ID=MMETSP1361-20130828/7119_1 /ASSEMBLY_ACC=CAM_ASM_000849 /TAXON_ID=210615 /ORGANISM="Staurosira complex sp., Strain CCMP2646" /LENGTH=421 /DNA_ID=CAMNT_0049119103 /DNA_START=57 /DNA_END=1322 /DNA_ORIENTATION=-
MPLFSSRKSSSNLKKQEQQKEPEQVCYYTVRAPWDWVMQQVVQNDAFFKQVASEQELVSTKIQANTQVTATPNIQHRRTTMKKGPSPCILRLEECFVENDALQVALHGTSAALDGLEDKDELVRTMQRCRCEQLQMCPPSLLIKWDMSRDELTNYLPSLPSMSKDHTMAVLKEPMGSSGEGIYFCQTIQQVYQQMERHKNLALEDGDYLDNIMNTKGRMPAWVLQAEVYPPMLISDGCKFHIRSNIVVVEKLWTDALLQVYIHNRHEVRIAGQPVSNTEDETRNVLEHITNSSTRRELLSNIEELAPMQSDLQMFLAKAFQAFMPDIIRRVGYSASQQQQQQQSSIDIRKFVVAGTDIMVTESGRFYLLEVNVNPTAPAAESCSPEFQTHLVGWMKDLVYLVLGRPSPNFLDINDISPVSE